MRPNSAVHSFLVARLGAESEHAIASLRSAETVLPIRTAITCKQVPQDVQPGDYVFVWLGTNNNKGGPTPWVQGLRAFGRIENLEGPPGYNEAKRITLTISVLLAESLTKKNFIEEAGAEFIRIADVPVLGINNYSSQVIQRIDPTDNSQDIGVLVRAIDRLSPGFTRAIVRTYPDLADVLLTEEPARQISPALANADYETPDEDQDGVELSPEVGEESILEPWDPTKTKFDTRPFTLDLLMRRVQYGEINLQPDFQRKAGLWSVEQKSRLIESLLVRIPLPAFYFDATAESRWLVVDGLQRMTVFQEFIFGDLRLEKLEFLSTYEGLRFRDLPRDLQRRIEETQVVVHLIQPGTPPQVKFNIFRRINTGGLVLTGQEIRHALFQGPATALLHSLAQNGAFVQATAGSIKSERMADREFVLRFLSFSITPPGEYRSPDMDSFLNAHMSRINNMSTDEVERLSRRFTQAMTAARQLFGEHAFRKLYVLGQGRSPINKALFEAWSVALGKLQAQEVGILIKNRDFIIQQSISALHDRQFEAAVSVGTQDVRKVRLRFSTIENIITITLNRSQSEFAL